MSNNEAQVRVERWGDSLAVKIPQSLIDSGKLTPDSFVNLRLDGDALSIKPDDDIPHYELDQLLAGMSRDQVHPEIDTGPPVGKEIW
jgi:antitoxin MazE